MKEKIKIAVIGLGQRGKLMIQYVLVRQPDVEIVAVCDSYADRASDVAELIKKETGKLPKALTDYKETLQLPLDAVVISTSWEAHIPIAIYAMERGIKIGMEVGGAYSIRECKKLVSAYEKTKTPLMFLENCCYNKFELLATAMARAGKFGKIVHCSGSYSHDLRNQIVHGKEKRHYRLRNYLTRNCENYPTHELGPIAKILDINRGNRMVSLVSVASKAEGLHQFIVDHQDSVDSSLTNVQFKQGDIVNTLITCANGETISIKLDTTLPRFYARELIVHGTKGLCEQNPNLIFLEEDQKGEFWEPNETYKLLLNNAEQYEKEFLPENWKNITKEALESGHGGMDHFVYRAFIDGVKNDTEFPIDVYDAVSWMCITCLSEKSIKKGNKPVKIPDFTHGKWKTRPRKDVF